MKLVGRADAPVIVRACPGKRATVLDDRVVGAEPAAFVVLRGPK